MTLKDSLKARFASAIQSIPPGTWKALVTDKHSQELIDTVYGKTELLRMNITSVEPLHSPRQPMQVEGVYILTPTAQNVDRLIADFMGGRKTYNSAHLYFIDAIDDKLANKITDALGQMGVLKAFVELYCDFWALEDRVFGMKTPSAFFSMYGTLGGQVSRDLAVEAFYDDLAVTGRTILDVLTTIGENPYIRYYQPTHHAPLGPLVETMNQPGHASQQQQQQQPQGSSLRWRAAMGSSSRSAEVTGEYLCKKIATQVQQELDQYLATNPEFPAGSDRPRGQLFIVDRSMDPAVPFLHEFWYQAMANDLLPIHDGHYLYKYENTVGQKEEREAVLSEEDEVWVTVRHLHMKDAIDRLMTDFGKFVQEHAGFRGNASNIQVNDLKDMLASLPQFQTQREQFSLHIDMAQECMALFEKHKLNLAANVEQCSATGFTPDGKTPKTIVEEMVPLLDDRAVSNLDKVRIIALYIIFRDGVADEDRRRLYQHARLSITEQDMINNLVHLGVKVIKGDGKDRFRGSRIKQKYSHSDESYDLSRYKPVVQIMIEEHRAGRLDQVQFPFLRDIPQEFNTSLRGGNVPAPSAQGGTSLRSARPTWHKASSARNNSEGRQRYIIFVAGGVTYSEIRQAYVLSEALGKDIIIGSTHIITPTSFLKDLKSLGRGGIGGNPPCGLPMHPQAPGRSNSRAPGQPMSCQKILDMRYWEPPVGPPPIAPPPGQQPQHNSSSKSKSSSRPVNSSPYSNLNDNFGNMSLSGSYKEKKKDEKKKNPFKMKWGKD